MIKLFCASLSCVALLSGCTTTHTSTVTEAATAPLSDLNLINAPVPAVLSAAEKAPYGQPASLECASLLKDVAALDEVLGADLDTPATETNPGLVERGASLVFSQATSSLRRASEGLVPYRAWVRKLSGAERYSKQVASAIAAGTIRRAFLKGIAVAQQCSKRPGEA